MSVSCGYCQVPFDSEYTLVCPYCEEVTTYGLFVKAGMPALRENETPRQRDRWLEEERLSAFWREEERQRVAKGKRDLISFYVFGSIAFVGLFYLCGGTNY